MQTFLPIEAVMDEQPVFESDSERWTAVRERLPEADGRFWYGVSSTGIYCRPVCTSRRPKRENVRFFSTPEQAEAAGFRPCKRCSPRDPHADPAAEAVVLACRLIEEAEQPPTLDELAQAVGLSKYHFQRLFKRVVGVTPWEYAAQVRSERVRAGLSAETAVTDAIYNAGYESSSRFYETAVDTLGMKPQQYQRGGSGVTMQFAIQPSYLGWVLVAATPQGVSRIDFGDEPDILRVRLQEQFPLAHLVEGDESFAASVAEVLFFLEEPRRGLALPLDIQGTAFQRRVWAALQQIPAGETASYSEVAARIGQPKAARAVAQACAANTLAVAVPCHRVIRSDGTLGGYRWGLARKETLLARETG